MDACVVSLLRTYVLLSPCEVADELQRELAFFDIAGHLDNEFIEAHGEIFVQTSAALRRGAGNGEDVRRFYRQQADGALKIVTGMRGDDSLMVDIEAGGFDVLGM